VQSHPNSSPAPGESFDFEVKDPRERSKGGVKNREVLGRILSSKLLLHNLSLFLSPSSLLSPCAYIPPVFRARMSRGGGEFTYLAEHSAHTRSSGPTHSGDDVTMSLPSSNGDLSSTHAMGPDSKTNGMQGHGIPFCGHCGRELAPQRIRRGETKRFCSDACRAKAWRRRNGGGGGGEWDVNAGRPQSPERSSEGRIVCAPNASPLLYTPCFWRARVYSW